MSLHTKYLRIGVLGLAIATFLTHAAAGQAVSLGVYNAAPSETSISGISSGAYMAVQFATAWSSTVRGVGAVAGGPYGCSGGLGSTALSTCMIGQPIADVGALAKLPERLAAAGRIDPPVGITRQRVYLFSGYNDAVVHRAVTNWLDAIYTKWLDGAGGALFYQTTVGAGHAQVTLSYGGACKDNGGAYINDCDYDQAGVILQHMYGALNPPNRGALQGAVIAFRQASYTTPAKPADYSLGETGFVFVPADCAAGAPCRVHVALHGCKQSYDNIREVFVRHAGYNAWADTNHIVVLYPQTAPSVSLVLFAGISNPEACWDWWGYLDRDPSSDPRFLTKDGPQIATLKRMVDRLTSGALSPASVVLPARQTLVVNDVSDTAVALAWTEVPHAMRYEVFRGSGDSEDMASIGFVSGLSFSDSGLRPKSMFRYQVRPILAAGPGAFTDIVTARTQGKPPVCAEPGTCRVAKYAP
ncbi:MAG: hypothetical protein JSS43_17685 [Proteobacteria bacterium]|nr:hypothetical protein [Pseudomonadota bacterium]